jgi:hypothetical protein
MAKKSVSKLSDKLAKVDSSFTVYSYDNGFMFEMSGRDKGGDYKTAKIMCPTVEDVIALVIESTEVERDD